MEPADRQLDVTGVCCPIPLIRLTQAISGMQPGQRLTVSGNDPLFESSVRDFCQSNGHELLSVEQGADRRVTMSIRIGAAG